MRSTLKFLAGPLAVCLACAVSSSAAAADVLYGITGGGAPSELRVIDPGTGSSETFMSLGLDAVVAATVAINSDATALYVAGSVGGNPTLVTIAPFLPTLTTVTLDRAFASLVVRADGVPVGFSNNAGTWELRSIDPATGVTTLIGSYPGIGTIAPSARILAPGNDVIQLVYTTAEPSVPRLFLADASSGASSSELSDLAYHSLGLLVPYLLGSAWNGSAEELRAITGPGTSTLLATYPAFGVLPPSANTQNFAAGDILQIGYATSASDPPHLYGMAVDGGGVPSDVALDEHFVAIVHAPAGPVLSIDGRETHVLAFGRAFPNPFRGETRFDFSLDRADRVRIQIVDVSGRVVRRLVEGPMEAGAHTRIWRGRDDAGHALPMGVYFARMRAGDREFSQRIVLLQ